MTSFQHRRRDTTTRTPVEIQLQHLEDRQAAEGRQVVDHMQVAVGRLVVGRQVGRLAVGDR